MPKSLARRDFKLLSMPDGSVASKDETKRSRFGSTTGVSSKCIWPRDDHRYLRLALGGNSYQGNRIRHEEQSPESNSFETVHVRMASITGWMDGYLQSSELQVNKFGHVDAIYVHCPWHLNPPGVQTRTRESIDLVLDHWREDQRRTGKLWLCRGTFQMQTVYLLASSASPTAGPTSWGGTLWLISNIGQQSNMKLLSMHSRRTILSTSPLL
ncbi:MAG TPA: hypothetical protein VGO47_02670 [Chlamydiales bacterium]|nr:hypothetical protein [Chlamydiales bacterium]